MSSLPATPASQTAAQPIPAATLNNHRDNLNFLLSPPRCKAYNSTAQSIANNAFAVVILDQEEYDTDGIHIVNAATTKLIPTTPGLYVVKSQLAFAGYAGNIQAQLRMNGATMIANVGSAASTGTAGISATAEEFFNGTTDYVEMLGFQSSGAGRAVATGIGNTFVLMRMVAIS